MKLIEKITIGITNLARKAGVCLDQGNNYTLCNEICENPENCSAYQKYLSD